MPIEIIKRKLDEMPMDIDIQVALQEGFAAIHRALEDLGERPFGELEIHMPKVADGTIYRWRKPSPRLRTI